MFVVTNWLWCKFRVVITSYRGWFLLYLLSRGFTVSMFSRGFTVFVIMGCHCICFIPGVGFTVSVSSTKLYVYSLTETRKYSVTVKLNTAHKEGLRDNSTFIRRFKQAVSQS